MAHKRETTNEERAARDRQRRVKQMARRVQAFMDRDTLYAKLPEVVKAMFGDDEMPDEDDDRITVEYCEEYGRRRQPMTSLVIKSGTSYLSSEKVMALIAIAKALDMVGSITQLRGEVDYDGDTPLAFVLRPSPISKLGEPSPQAMEAAEAIIAAEEASESAKQ